MSALLPEMLQYDRSEQPRSLRGQIPRLSMPLAIGVFTLAIMANAIVGFIVWYDLSIARIAHSASIILFICVMTFAVVWVVAIAVLVGGARRPLIWAIAVAGMILATGVPATAKMVMDHVMRQRVIAK